jgi:hypothetical protein
MKKLYVLLFLFTAFSSNGQNIIWTENFITNTCGQGTIANGYSTPNGSWMVTPTGTNDPEANLFYISATENGNGTGNCGTACGTNRTLHVGANDGFYLDEGASYDAGGLCGSFNICVLSNWRAESPVINCTGAIGITLTFNYMEFGYGALDDASLWYYDGTSWSLLDTLAKTACCGGPCNGNRQGQWTYFSIQLPGSASNNSNVKIGFNWTNNDDANGIDPSFAVDDIQLSSFETGVNESYISGISIFPNPAFESIIVNSTSSIENFQYIICDISGRQVAASFLDSERRINISSLSAGYYSFHLLTDRNGIIASSSFIRE